MAIRLEDQELLDVFDSGHDDEFNALNDDENGWLKQLVKARDSGTTLAKHRWEQAKTNKAALELGTAQNTFPTPQGNIPYQGTPPKQGVDLLDPNGPQQQVLPTLPPIAAGEAPPLERFAKNAGIGLLNAGPGTVNFVGDLATKPVETMKGIGEFIKAAGKAGAWAILQSQHPQAAEALKEKDISPDQFNEIFMNDPVATSMMILGGVEGIRRSVKAVPKGLKALDTKILGEAPPPPAVPEDLRGAVDAMGYPKNSLLPDMSDPAVAEAQRARLQKSLAPVKTKVEKRNPTGQRELITAAVDDIRQAGADHIQALDEISRRKQMGEITGPQESAMIREASKVYSNKLAPPMGDTTPGGGKTQAEMGTLNEVQAKLEARARLPQPDPPTASTGLSDLGDHEIVNGGVLENLAAAFGESQMSEFANANDFAVGAIDKLKGEFDTGGIVETHFGSLPKFFKNAWKQPDLFSAFVKKMAAKDDATVAVTEKIDHGLNKILTRPRDRALFGKYLVTENALALPEDAPVRGVKLTPVEISRLREPEFQAALKFFDEHIKPELAQWKDEAGIKSFRVTPSDRYMKFMPVSKTGEPPKGTWVVDSEGNTFQWNKGASTKFRASGMGRGVLGKSRKLRAGAARQATGAGEYWVVEPKVVFENALVDRLGKARHNQLIDVVKSYEVTPDEAKAGVTEGGERVVRVAVNPVIQRADTTPVAQESVAVPATVAQVYEYSRNPPRLEDVPGLAQINRQQVGLMLLSPAEGAVHGINVYAALYRQPGIGGKYGAIGRLLAKDPTGVVRSILTLAEIVDQSGPRLANNIRRLSTHGAVRASQFAGEETGLQKIPILKHLKQAVFDYPNLSKRTLYGLETRGRTAMLDLLDRSPDTAHWTDAQKATVINNEFGTYVQDLQPTLVKLGRSIPGGDSFAAAGVALTKGAAKAAFTGKSGRPSSIANNAEVIWSAWAPAIFTPIILNVLLDPEHRLPWHIPGLKAGNVRIYKTDKATVDIPLRLLTPGFSRGSSIIGLQDTMNDIAKGKASPQRILDNAWRGVANTALGRIGPFGRTLWTGLMGTAPHLNPDGSMLQIADKSATQATQNKWKAAVTTALPSKDFQESFAPESSAANLSPVMRKFYAAMALVGQRLQINPSEEMQAAYENATPDAGLIIETIKDIQRHARRISDPKARQEYINKRVANDLPKRKR